MVVATVLEEAPRILTMDCLERPAERETADNEPSYSPSGKKIAFSTYDGNDYEIWTIQLGGGGRQQVTDNGADDNDPYWGSQ